MIHHTKRYRSLMALTMLLVNQVSAAPQIRPLTIEDCVRTRRIVEGEVTISPDGSSVAYVVKSPDIVSNRNNYQLYIRDLRQLETRGEGRLLLQADKISGTRWLDRGRIVAEIGRIDDPEKGITSEVDIVDAVSGKQEALSFPSKVEDYSISADGSTIVFSTLAARSRESASAEAVRKTERETRGYRVQFGNYSAADASSFGSFTREYELYVGKINESGLIDTRRLLFTGSQGFSERSSLPEVRDLNLSPDGKHLLLNYEVETMPVGWKGHPLMNYFKGHGGLPIYSLLGMYDLESGELKPAFDSPESGFYTHTSWAFDSRAFAVVGPSPIGTLEGEKEAKDAVASGNVFYHLLRFSHVFAVDVKAETTTRVLSRDSGVPGSRVFSDTPLRWNHSDGEMLIRSGDYQFVRMSNEGGEWKERQRFEIPERGNFLSSFVSDGNVLVGVSQSATNPAELFVMPARTAQMTLITDLNPSYRSISLGQADRIEWKNRYGSRCGGKLIKPVNYEAGRRYPLVLMASDFSGDIFISDTPYTTAFAPQSLANAGFLVLMAKYSGADKEPTSEFPAGIAAAYDWMSMQESAIDLLVQRGMADKSNVGIVGFSRTSWLTDFTLTHSAYKFTAASSADGGANTYGAYFGGNQSGDMTASESEYGGPPYGKTLSNWLQYAPPFKAGNVQAAVLMESTYINGAFEFFVALARQGKAVELYYYPKGAHPLDTPFERLASLQRNVDWFRFWMQGYEGKAPNYDPEQYVRWRRLRKQQEWNDRMRAQGKDPSTEFLRQTAPGAILGDAEPAPAAGSQRN
jgi:dipeptidyl aminopeptidase/acylaminoacyl peptidase